MRKLVVSTIMSLDGLVEGPGGDVMALPMDDVSFNSHNLERLRAAGTLLAGRVTFQGFVSYWPPQLTNPDPVQREIAEINDRLDKVVVSDQLRPEDAGVWRDRTRILRRDEAHAAIAELKAGNGKDILMFGSRIVWSDLLAVGLVDELYVLVGNVVIGEGTPAFDAGTRARLRLLETRTWSGSDNVLIRYAAN